MATASLRAIESTIIRASAGTGKTQQLSARYLQLLNAGADPQRMVAATFTRKAAGEIFARVVDRLTKAVYDAEKRQQLATDLDLSSLDRERCLSLLAALTARLHLIQVSTLDSYFYQQLVRNHQGGVIFADRSIADESTVQRLRNDAINELLQDESVDLSPWLHALARGDSSRRIFPVVQQVVEQQYQLFLESKESGRAAWTIAVPPGRLTAASLADGVRRLTEMGGLSLSLGRARDQALENLANENWSEFLTKGIANGLLKNGKYKSQVVPAPLADLYQPLIAHARACLIAQWSDYTEAAYELLDRFDAIYESVKEQSRLTTFDDLPRHLTGQGHSAADPGSARQASGWDDPAVDHLLLDEFQDTSLAQWRALETMARRIVAGPASSLLCVGDTKQSIYGWRGGVPELLTALPQILPQTTTEDLVENFRSSPVIIEVVNRLFEQARNIPETDPYAPAIQAWCSAFEKHTTGRSESGHVTLRTAREGALSALIDDASELVQQLVEAKPAASIAVLVTQNEEVAAVIHRLRQLGIDASEEGGQPLTDSAAVRILLSGLKLAEHPGDSVSRFHLTQSPLGAIIEPDSAAGQASAASDRATARWRRRLFHGGLARTLAEWSGYLTGCCSIAEWRRVQQMVQCAETWDLQGWTSVMDFVHFVETERVGLPMTSAIRVMTVHRAKGLQFDAVVVIGLDGSLFRPPEFAYTRDESSLTINRVMRYPSQAIQPVLPAALRVTAEATVARLIQERLCVLYVAVTRAKRALHIIVKPSTGSENRSTSLAGLLRAALAPAQVAAPGTILLEVGDANWSPTREAEDDHGGRTGPSAAGSEAERASARTDAGVVSPWPRRSSSPASFRSPSALEGHARVDVAALFAGQRQEARDVGSLIHRVLEQIEWLPDEASLRQQVHQAMARARLDSARYLDLGSQLCQWIAADALQSLLCRSRFPSILPDELREPLQGGELILEVRNEQSVAAPLPRDHTSSADTDFGSGIIDRLVIATRHHLPVWAGIVDFKTDPITSASKAARVDFYRPQLLAYRDLVSQTLALDPSLVRADLCFVLSGTIERIS